MLEDEPSSGNSGVPVLSIRAGHKSRAVNLGSELLYLAFLAEVQGGSGVEELRRKAAWELWVAGMGL